MRPMESRFINSIDSSAWVLLPPGRLVTVLRPGM